MDLGWGEEIQGVMQGQGPRPHFFQFIRLPMDCFPPY